MNDSTIIALSILAGIFLIMTISVVKHGVDDSLKLWGGLGALTGIALGGITSFYFTKNINENEIYAAEMRAENNRNVAELAISQLNRINENPSVITPPDQALPEGGFPMIYNEHEQSLPLEGEELNRSIDELRERLAEINTSEES